LHTDIKEAGPFERMITIRLAEDELESAKNRAARKLSKSMKIKGFRPGKAPRSIVERMVGSRQLRAEAIEEALPELVGPAIEQAELEPATTPRLDAVRDDEDGGVAVDIKVTLWPIVDAVPDFSGREIEVDSPEVSDEEIDQQVDRLRNQYAELEDVARPAFEGDFVLVNITASHDGVEIPEATANDLLYEVGSNSFISGLDEILTGAGEGDIREGPGTLPAGFGEDEARPAELRVLVKGVRAKKLPEVTDEWVSDVSEFDTIAELTDRIRTNLSVMKLDAAQSRLRNLLIEQLGDELALEMPEALVDAEIEAAFHNLAHTLDSQGIEFADYLRIVGQDQEAFVADMRERAQRTLRSRVLLDSVAAIEGLDVADEELDEAIAEMASEVNQDAAGLRANLESSGRLQVLAGDILRRKALDRIVASAIAVDGDGQHIDLRPPQAADDTEEDGEETDPAEAAPVAESPTEEEAE
jgi:trigger factor